MFGLVIIIIMETYLSQCIKRVLVTQATSKGSGETAHKRSLARAFAVRRHVVETLRKFQKKTHVCSPNREERMRVWRTTNGKIIMSLFSCASYFIIILLYC